MGALTAPPCYELRLRAGLQDGLLSPLLASLCGRLQQIPGAGVTAAVRSFEQRPSEARVLVRLPGYPRQKARNFLVEWAETTIDHLNHAQPYSTTGLIDQRPAHGANPCHIVVRCDAADPALWLGAHAEPGTGAALVAMSEHLPRLLSLETALLKTALPVAISTSLNAQRRPAALSKLVFANTPSRQHVDEMLGKREALERAGQLVRRDTLPAKALPVFGRLVSTLQHGIAMSAHGARFPIIRMLLNQLGFTGPESDYLILLALPSPAPRLLKQNKAGRS